MTPPHPPENPPGTRAAARPDRAMMLEVLSRGDIDVIGRLVDASNATLYATVRLDDIGLHCVYKPVAGERPLWDFPAHTLARRETAAYLVCAAAGWGMVPPTVLRDGPFGPGSVQWWVGDPGEDPSREALPSFGDPGAGLVDVVAPEEIPAGWLKVIEAEGFDGSPVALVHADDDDLRRMAVFDIVVNNADRKGGHVVRDLDGTIYGVDHGLTFNVDDKLRTILWGWAGDRLPDDAREAVARLGADLAARSRLRRQRAAALAGRGRFPLPRAGRPNIPWPAF